jgi:hypothetical protein
MRHESRDIISSTAQFGVYDEPDGLRESGRCHSDDEAHLGAWNQDLLFTQVPENAVERRSDPVPTVYRLACELIEHHILATCVHRLPRQQVA